MWGCQIVWCGIHTAVCSLIHFSASMQYILWSRTSLDGIYVLAGGRQRLLFYSSKHCLFRDELLWWAATPIRQMSSALCKRCKSAKLITYLDIYMHICRDQSGVGTVGAAFPLLSKVFASVPTAHQNHSNHCTYAYSLHTCIYLHVYLEGIHPRVLFVTWLPFGPNKMS